MKTFSKFMRVVLVIIALVVALGIGQAEAQGPNTPIPVCKALASVVNVYGDGTTYDDGTLSIHKTIVSTVPHQQVIEYRAYWHQRPVAKCINTDLVEFRRGAWWARVKKLVRDAA